MVCSLVSNKCLSITCERKKQKKDERTRQRNEIINIICMNLLSNHRTSKHPVRTKNLIFLLSFYPIIL